MIDGLVYQNSDTLVVLSLNAFDWFVLLCAAYFHLFGSCLCIGLTRMLSMYTVYATIFVFLRCTAILEVLQVDKRVTSRAQTR